MASVKVMPMQSHPAGNSKHHYRYREFQRFLDNMTGVDASRFGKISNNYISCEVPDIRLQLEQFRLPQQTSTNFIHIRKLLDNQVHQVDFNVVSIDVWHFLKKFYGADTDVVVFVTKHAPTNHKCFQCDNLEQGLCIPQQFINISAVFVHPESPTQLCAIFTPASPEQEILFFRTYLLSLLRWDGMQSIKFCSEGYIYVNNKKAPFRGSRTLTNLGVTRDMQIVIACQNLSLLDIEEEMETDGEEIEVEQNLHEKEDFLQLLNTTLSEKEITLRIKSIEEIKQVLEQNSFFN